MGPQSLNIDPKTYKPITKGRRFLASLADFFLLIILGETLYFFVTFNLTKILPSYSNCEKEAEISYNICKDAYLNSHLAISVDGSDNILDNEAYLKKTIQDKISDLDYKETDHSLVDPLYYFYISYMSNEPVQGKITHYDFNYVNKNIFHNDSAQSDPKIWNFDTYNNIIHLTEKSKEHIKNYYKGNYTQEDETYYNKVAEFYKENLLICDKTLQNTDLYISNYSNMYRNNNLLSLHYTVGSTITYVICFFVIYIMFPLIFKKEKQTLGKKIMKIGLYNEQIEPLSKTNFVLRELLEFLLLSFVCIFFPYLRLGLTVIGLPLIIIGNFSFSLLIYSLIIGVASLISVIVTFFNKNGQCLFDLATKSLCVDLKKKELLDSYKAGELDGGSNV